MPRPELLACALALALSLTESVVRAAEVSGGVTVAATSTDARGVETDTLRQQYRLDLFQEWTPYLTLRFSYRDIQFDGESSDGGSFDRSSRAPRLDLNYTRQRLSLRLSADGRFVSNSAAASDTEIRSLSGNMTWRPSRGPSYSVDFRDESNVADRDFFGFDNETQIFGFRTFYSRAHWGGSYEWRSHTFDNRTLGSSSEQQRHEFRGQTSRSFFDQRLAVSLSASASLLDRSTNLSAAFAGAEVVTARQGLFAVDTSPEVGRLEPAPELIDGNRGVAAAPGIDIGAANTFRNLGVDLGITRPVSRLQVWVDGPSSAGVMWRVFRSRDNLVWEEVTPAASTFAPDLQVYTIRFQETSDRFFKVVNVSANSVPEVRVTEVRAQVDFIRSAGQETLETSLYRYSASATYRPSDRITARVEAYRSNDEDVAAGFVRRDYEAETLGVQVSAELTRELRLSVAYRLDDSNEQREVPIIRSQESLSANLEWDPLPTLVAVLTAQERDESDEGRVIQTDRSVQLRVAADLWPGFVDLVTDVRVSEFEDPFTGRSRAGRSWRGTLSTRPLPRLRLDGFYGYTDNEGFEGETVFERRNYGLSTVWSATGFLSLTGSYSINEQASRKNAYSSISVSYVPGPKLRISAALQETDTDELSATGSDVLSIRYRLNPSFGIFGNLTRSRTATAADGGEEITTARAGLQLTF